MSEAGGEDWYANLLWFDRRKCVLLTHASTLFSVFVADVRKQDLVPFGPFVVLALRTELAAERLPLDTFGPLDVDDVALAKTASRQILGCMNDMARMCEYAIADAGGLARCDMTELNRRLRRNINSPTGYSYPIRLTRDRVERRP